MTKQELIQSLVVGALAPLLWGKNGLISKRLDKWRDAPRSERPGRILYALGKGLGSLWPRSKKQLGQLLSRFRVRK